MQASARKGGGSSLTVRVGVPGILEYVLAIDREPTESGWFGATMQAYGVQGIPAAAVIDRAGKLVYLGQFGEALTKAAGLLNQE